MAKNATAEAASAILEQHPVAQQLVPGSMSDEEFNALCEDIKARGQRLKITMYQGKILDGMTRYRACQKVGRTPEFTEYEGDDPAGLVIALNVLRRKMGSTQRALAGARLNMEYNVTQEDASRRVGISKVHISLVVQALRSKNARIIKMLENGELTREQLHEELVDSGVMKPTSYTVSRGPDAPSTLSGAGATAGLEALFGRRSGPDDDEGDDEDDNDILGGSGGDDEGLNDLLGAPPSAGGRVINTKGETSAGGMPTVGTKPSHPERRTKDTPAYRLAEQFKGLPEAERISFIQIAWPTLRPLIKAAGVSVELPVAATAAALVADAAITKAATTAAAGAAKPAKAPAKRAAKGSKAAAATKGDE